MNAPAQLPKSKSSVSTHGQRTRRTSLLASTALVAGMAMTGGAFAQQAWDPDAAAGLQGGTGTWDGATANWTTDAGATNSTYDGTTPVPEAIFGTAGGTVTVSGAQNIGNLTFDVDGYEITGSSLTMNPSSNIDVTTGAATIASTIAGTTLTKGGTGTLTLSGANTYTGDTNVYQGTLVIDSANALGTNNNRYIDVQATSGLASLDLGGFTISASNIIANQGGGGQTISNGTVSVSGTTRIGVGTIGAVLAGAGSLQRISLNAAFTGNLAAANTYTGSTDVQGRLIITSTGSILTTSSIDISGAGVLRVDGAGGNAISDTMAITNAGRFELFGSDETIGSIAGTGGISVGAGTNLILSDGTTHSIDGVISGAGGLTINKSGGAVTLSRSNTYTGTTTLEGGALTLANSFAIADPTVGGLGGAVVVNDGTLNVTASETIGALSGTGGSIVLTNSASLFSSARDSSSREYAGTITGDANTAFSKRGSDNLTLSGVVGAPTVIVEGGTLTLTNTGNAMTALSVDGGRLNIGATGTTNGAAIAVGGAATIGITGTVTNSSAIAAPGNTAFTLDVDGADTATLTGAVASGGGDITKTGIGTLNLDGGTTTTGALGATAGAVVLGGTNSLGSIVANGGSVTLDAAAVTTVGTASVADGTLTLAGTINGLTAITVGDGIGAHVDGADRLVIGTALTGATTITTMGSDIVYTSDSGALILLSSDDTRLEVTNAGDLFTQSGEISQDASSRPIEKIGAGELILSVANIYTGETKVTAGTLNVTGSVASTLLTVEDTATLVVDGAALDDAAAVTLNGTGNLIVDNADETIGSLAAANAGSSVTLNAGLIVGDTTPSTTVASKITGAGGLTKQGDGTLVLSNENTYTGATTVTAGILDVTGSVASTMVNVDGGSLKVDGASIANTAAVTLAGTGNLTLTGDEEVGTLSSASATATVQLNGHQLVAGDNGDQTFAGVISSNGANGGTFTLQKKGNGTLALTGQNTFAGVIDVLNNGTLTLNNAGGDAIASTASIRGGGGTTANFLTNETMGVIDGGISINLGGNTVTLTNPDVSGNLSGVVSGTGSLVNAGAYQTLSGINTYTGSTTVTGGILTLAGGQAIVDTGAVVVNGGTLALSANETIGSLAGAGGGVNLVANALTTGGDGSSTSYAGAISGVGGTLSKAGTGNFTLSGTNTYTGTTTINGGTLTLTTAGSIDSATVTIGGSGTLLAQGNSFDASTAIGNSGVFTVSGDETAGSLDGIGDVNVNGAAVDLTVGGANSDMNISGIVAGDGGLIKTGTGVQTLSGANTIKNLTVQNGVLRLTGDNSGMVAGGGVLVAGGELVLGHNNAAGGAGGKITTTGSTITYLDGVNDATPIALNSDTTKLNVALVAESAEQSGVISDFDATPRPIEKIGAGTLTLSADNTYGNTGVGAAQGTNVTAGRLIITGSIDSSTVSVAAGAGLTLGSVSASPDGAVKDTAAIVLNGAGADLTLTADETVGSRAAADGTSTIQLGATS
ncbi:autotransporter-associated beta strand repeat-containing protein, partial [Pseudorhodobacter sp.]|uniref:beta strand repeat-containing protein n=1 Tax=Pseudorhodobacter sp. TaxID=1934400 RepID=UPI00264941CA